MGCSGTPETKQHVHGEAVFDGRAHGHLDIDLKPCKPSVMLLICFQGIEDVVDRTGSPTVADPCRTEK